VTSYRGLTHKIKRLPATDQPTFVTSHGIYIVNFNHNHGIKLHLNQKATSMFTFSSFTDTVSHVDVDVKVLRAQANASMPASKIQN